MSKIKVIVELDEKDYELAKADKIPSIGLECRHVLVAVRDGELYDGSIGDCISREALKGEVRKRLTGNNLDVFYAKKIMRLIDNAPTVEYTFEEAFQKTVCENRLYCPARPQGEWIDERNDGGGCVAICSNCKTLEVTGRFCRTCGSDNTQSFLKSFKCGADMRGGAE